MTLGRTAILAIFVILLLVPIAGFTPTFAYKQAQTNPQITTNPIVSNHTVSIPLSLPSVISESIALGAANPSTQVSLGIILPQRDPIGLQQYISKVTSTKSKMYHDFLTTQQFAELYGPSPTEARSLSSFLSSKGLTVSFDSSNPDLLIASGSAGIIEKTLQVSINSFRLSGTSYYSATSNIQLPSEFSNIQTVFGLTNYRSELNLTQIPMYKILGPVNSSQSTNLASVYYSPSEIGQVYGATPLWNAGYNGSGVTIAIVDAYGDPFIQQELNNFSAEFNLPSANVNEICVDGPCNYASGIAEGWATEIALDVEWAHAMAPGARINLYVAANATFPLFDAVQKAVSDGVNSIISLSWGSPENAFGQSGPVAPIYGENYPWLNQVFQQAAAQGITVFASSGDWGAYDQSQGETAPYGGAVYPSTDPYVTGVGGTTLYMNSTSGYLQLPYANASGSYGAETAWSWSNSQDAATGGGYSTLFGVPSWQSGPGFAGTSRGAPDVGWDANPSTGVLVAISNGLGQPMTYYIVGGTSVGSPSWAGSLALIDQKAGGKLGSLNPAIYSILNNSGEYSKAFHDITVGNNNPNSAGVGWDPLTGVGTPDLSMLASYLAPTGSLDVSVQTQLSSSPTKSFAYGSAIVLSADITSGSSAVSSAIASATLTGPSGQIVASNIPLAYDPTYGTWTGRYVVQSSNPAGMWTAVVHATNGVASGTGSASFSVGDGITILLPYYDAATNTAAPLFVIPGEIINVSAMVTSPAGQCCVATGNYKAVFTLNSPSGKLEGSIPLTYEAGSQEWQGSFKVPHSADQGSWILTVNGTDAGGNKGSAYSWLNVGLDVLLSTDAPSYISKNSVTIFSAPVYPDGLETAVGNFTATVSQGNMIISKVPMTFNWLYTLWTGTFTISNSDPTGFYNITVSGNDGAGVSGSFSTVIRVAPYNLEGKISLPAISIPINGGSVSTISAKIGYPSGAVMKTGSVEAYVSYDMSGVLLPVTHLRLTYQASTQSFVGPGVFPTASVLSTAPGQYLVEVFASDSSGNYGNLTTSFLVSGIPHAPISINSDSQFTAANGVIKGSGSQADPYIIAGWNTTSIAVSSAVSSSYELLNDWVQGSSGSGITINTPNSQSVYLNNVTVVSSHGDGLVVTNSSTIAISGVVASHNSENGIVLSAGSSGSGQLVNSVASNNGANGIELMDAPLFSISSSAATGNTGDGFFVSNSMNATLFADNATSNSVGLEITGTPKHSYGGAQVVNGYYEGNNIGIEVNGLGQFIEANSTTLSSALIDHTAQLGNRIGTLALNDSIVELQDNAIGLSNYGAVIQNSLPLIVGNIITQNSGSGLNISGSFLGNGYCEVQFTNGTNLKYNSCIADNYVTSNGDNGAVLSSLNDSFSFDNAALGNVNDGFVFENITGSLVSTQLSLSNENNGLTVSDSSNSRITQNQAGGNLNGLEVRNSSNNTIDLNNATQNYLDGILLYGSAGNVVSNNVAIENANGCTSQIECTAAAGLELYASSGNVVTQNTLTNNSSPIMGAGIYLNSRSNENSVILNNASLNYAGILLSTSIENNIAKNSLSSNSYGVYLLNAPTNSIISNEYNNVTQSVYPDQPSVVFSGISNGTSVRGNLNLSWRVTGQAIAHEDVLIDGNAIPVNGTDYTLKSISLPDAYHTITIKVTNIGGLSANSSLIIYTRNHEGLGIETLGPSGTPLPGIGITLSGPGLSLNSTTGPNGIALFSGLIAGQYTATAIVNDTYASLPVNFTNNETVSIFFPIISTSLDISSSGTSSRLTLHGNITASNLSNIDLKNANGVYSLSFDISGTTGTTGFATLTIPKSVVPGGLAPTVFVGGIQGNNESYTQDSHNYYVPLNVTLASATQVSIQFSRVVNINFNFLILSVIIVAVIAAGLAIALRRPRKDYSFGVP